MLMKVQTAPRSYGGMRPRYGSYGRYVETGVLWNFQRFLMNGTRPTPALTVALQRIEPEILDHIVITAVLLERARVAHAETHVGEEEQPRYLEWWRDMMVTGLTASVKPEPASSA